MAIPDAPQGEQIHVDLDPAAVVAAHARHRRRFADEVGKLDGRDLEAQSRCDRWSVADVLRHITDVDDWMQAIWSGGRPPFDHFDPVTTPHEFVVAGRASMSDLEARDRFVGSCEVMASDVSSAPRERWATTSISPLGFVPWWLSALHVFYDSWVHERDALLPLGRTPPVDAEEVIPVLAYSLALVGTLVDRPLDTVIAGVRVRTGERPVRVTPLDRPVVDAETGSVIDAVSGRGTLSEAVSGIDPDVAEAFTSLARLFGAGEGVRGARTT
jgi:uncharacterized protein (TIGR03083 family)